MPISNLELTRCLALYDQKPWKRRLLAPIYSIYTVPEKLVFGHLDCLKNTIRLPNFLGIGGPQSGSTWLFENLRVHPEIFMPRRKELRYFSAHFYKSLFWYASRFRDAKDRVCGEISPDYSFLSPGRIKCIKKLMPEVRLIFIARNPVDRVWSTARRVLSRMPNLSIPELTLGEFQTFFEVAACRKKTDYERILNSWSQTFDTNQLYVGFFDDILKRPEKILTEIFQHIGVSDQVDWDSFPFHRTINKNPDAEMPSAIRVFLGEVYSDQIKALHQQFGDKVAAWKYGPGPKTSDDRSSR